MKQVATIENAIVEEIGAAGDVGPCGIYGRGLAQLCQGRASRGEEDAHRDADAVLDEGHQLMRLDDFGAADRPICRAEEVSS